MKVSKLYVNLGFKIRHKWLLYVWYFAHKTGFKRLDKWLFKQAVLIEMSQVFSGDDDE